MSEYISNKQNLFNENRIDIRNFTLFKQGREKGERDKGTIWVENLGKNTVVVYSTIGWFYGTIHSAVQYFTRLDLQKIVGRLNQIDSSVKKQE